LSEVGNQFRMICSCQNPLGGLEFTFTENLL
jgi:hypothetical protein